MTYEGKTSRRRRKKPGASSAPGQSRSPPACQPRIRWRRGRIQPEKPAAVIARELSIRPHIHIMIPRLLSFCWRDSITIYLPCQ